MRYRLFIQRLASQEHVLAAEKAQELMEFYLLDLSVRGEYPPYVKSYLKKK